MIYITLFPAEIGLSFSVTSNTKQTANWLERGATGDPAHLDHEQDPTRARSPAAPLIPHPVDDYVADPPQTVVDSTGTVVGEVLKIEGVGMSAASIKYPLAGGEYVVLSVSGGSIGTIGSSHNREAPQGCLTLLTSAARRRPPLEKMECGTLLPLRLGAACCALRSQGCGSTCCRTPNDLQGIPSIAADGIPARGSSSAF